MNKLPAQKVNGAIHAMELLQELATEQTPVSGLELSRRLDLSPVQVNRLLKTLAYLGFAYRTASRKYAAGPAMHVLAVQSMASSGLLRAAYESLEDLQEHVPTVALGVLWKGKVCYLFHKTRGQGMGLGLNPQFLYDAWSSSIGQALLAEQADAVIPEGKEGVLEKIRQQRYAAVEFPDHYSLAVTIGTPSFAAIAASGIVREEEIKPMVEKLWKHAQEIERKIKHIQ